jgi:hypothetical protein
MTDSRHIAPVHPRISRRTAIQAGSIGLLGLGMNHLQALQTAAARGASQRRAKSVIYIFLSGGLSQIDSFDPKPEQPDKIRGEFSVIDSRTPGIQVCEHLPRLADRSNKWAMVRSLTHPYNEHSEGHMVMLAGRTPLPTNFSGSRPQRTDWPSIAAAAGHVLPRRNNLPPAIVLPETLVHVSGRVIPGQDAGMMGKQRDPWIIEASQFRTSKYIHGAFPEFGFHRTEGSNNPKNYVFEAPSLNLPRGVFRDRLDGNVKLLNELNQQRRALDQAATSQSMDRFRGDVVSLLVDPKVNKALDVHSVDGKVQDRYGRNSFGWSLLMARQLVEAGVSLVQVNLGNDETWDTHYTAFPNFKNFLFPPTDKCISALIDDLDERGLLDETLVVIAGEFGRTPKVFAPPKYELPGRDHWGMVQTVVFFGGGVQGGAVIGSSDKTGGYPASEPQTPENMAATIYDALGLPPTTAWYDKFDRPHHLYYGEPIAGLM